MVGAKPIRLPADRCARYHSLASTRVLATVIGGRFGNFDLVQSGSEQTLESPQGVISGARF
jgi:hypothetical protein